MIYFKNDDVKKEITCNYYAPLSLPELRQRAKFHGYSLAYFNVNEHGAEILINDDYLGLNEFLEPDIGEGIFEEFTHFEEAMIYEDKKTQLKFKELASEHYKRLFTEIYDIFAIGSLIMKELDIFDYINPTKKLDEIYPYTEG